jgi:hypothetical protein
MNEKENRREFLKHCTKLGMGCLPFIFWHERLFGRTGDSTVTEKPVLIDPQSRSYCGIACEEGCELYKATMNNDVELKKKVYMDWKWKEQFNMDFDPDKVFCYNCKPENGKLKAGMAECKVRQCAIKNNLASCIQCSNLSACDQDLWTRWPKFYEGMLKTQQQYLSQPGAALIDIRKS